MRWDVFCRVIDNYGDAGVCWRLARQLAAEHRLDVTLWIDRPDTLARLEPALDPRLPRQHCRGVTLRALDDATSEADERTPAFDPGDVVVEAFGCGLPERYLDAMVARSAAPLWFNLEYLSAEPWVDGVHGLASQQPQRRLTRYFWFPGFTAKTGGLLREAGLFEARDAVQRGQRFGSTTAEADAGADCEGGVRALSIVVFAYSNRGLPSLFELWSQGDAPIRCVVHEGVATAALSAWLGAAPPRAPQRITRGALTIDLRPFESQDAFDRLLWCADFNFVRGEDSFVRAQWAARPFAWQPYPQEDAAHRTKLDAFLARYLPGAADPAQGALRRLAEAFAAEDGPGMAAAWPAIRDALPALTAHARGWCAAQAMLPDLASGLVAFAHAKL